VELCIVDRIALGPQDVPHVPIGDETARPIMEGRIGLEQTHLKVKTQG
jgi:hypothetical protein